MTMDATLAIQKGIIDKLLVTVAVTNLVGTRIYDRVEKGTLLPYISIGPSQSVQDDFECGDAYEVFQQIDVWSDGPGYVKAKQIAGEVRKAIHDATLILDGQGYVLVEIRHQSARFFRDADGITSHAVIDFRALVETDE